MQSSSVLEHFITRSVLLFLNFITNHLFTVGYMRIFSEKQKEKIRERSV